MSANNEILVVIKCEQIGKTNCQNDEDVINTKTRTKPADSKFVHLRTAIKVRDPSFATFHPL